LSNFKPENLLYSDKDIAKATIKVSDFGLARFVQPDAFASTTCGTPGYVAPEIVSQQPYGKECDYWSIGIVLYILLCGYPPFYDEDNMVLFEKIKAGKFEFPEASWGKISDEVKDLLKKILEVDPAKRLAPEQMIEHPWFAKDLGSGPSSVDTITAMREWKSKGKI
jgi:calcium/calmodulin-dependent protein kinase I